MAAGLIVAVVLFRAPLPMVALGSAAPDFQLTDLQGREITLAAQRGRVVFVNFWATWCPPCRDEAPSLQRLYDQLGSESFEILAVSIDAPSAQGEVAEFSREFGLTFPVLLDPNKGAHRAYGVTGVPETYMIDPQGRLVERFIGPRDWDDPRYVRTVRRLQQAGVEVATP
jgi:peroxiredoxin